VNPAGVPYVATTMHSGARIRSGLVALSLAFLAGMSALVVGVAPDTASATTHTVSIVEFSFSPSNITINVGDTVKWVHDSSSVQHSVTADDGSFDSSPNCPPTCLGANSTFSHTFTKAGTFRYYCRIHGGPGGVGMSGIVTVKSSTTSHPKVTAVNPSSIRHGAKNVKTTITGSGFVTGIKIKFSGKGITISSPHRVDSKHLTMLLTVSSTAAKTSRSVTVTNVDGGTFTKTGALKIT
jgi:plastocyanin